MIINPGKIRPEITLPTSKSISNRLLILAALDPREIFIKDICHSDDVNNLLKALGQIGLEINNNQNRVSLKNSFPECEKSDETIDIGEGGTTLHFLMGLLALGEKRYTLLLSEGLGKRPHDDLIQALSDLGVYCIQENNQIIVQGPITKTSVSIKGDISSQFASTLALIKNKGNFDLIINQFKSSESFYHLTLNVIKNFSISNTVPVDMASLSYPFCFALLNHEILITNCFKIDFNQPDSKIYEIFKDQIIITPNGLKIIPWEKKKPININLKEGIDLIPSMSFLASYLPGESKISGIQNLIYKESNRLIEMKKLLTLFNIHHRTKKGDLFIQGGVKLSEMVNIHTAFDHRMVMTAYLFLKHNGGGDIEPTQSVQKSFPDFFKELDGSESHH